MIMKMVHQLINQTRKLKNQLNLTYTRVKT